MPHKTKQRPSAVLILALLLMGAIIGSAISLSTVISDSGNQSQTLNDFIAASLIADTGLERGLGVVKEGRRSADLDTAKNNVGFSSVIPELTVIGTSTASSQLKWPILRPSESVSFDILEPPGGFSGNVSQITLSGTLTSVGAQSSQAKIDASWVGLDANAQPYYSGRTVINPSVTPFPVTINLLDASLLRNPNGSLIGTSGTVVNLSLTKGFRIRLTAVDTVNPSADKITLQSINQLSVSNASGGFPGRIEITSTGKTNQSQSQKKASVLWQLPATPAFGYVLFTEGDIIPE